MEESIQYLILFLNTFINLLSWIIIAQIIGSWIFTRPNRFMGSLQQITNPLLRPFRWARIGMIDFSPFVALIVLDMVRGLSISILIQYVS